MSPVVTRPEIRVLSRTTGGAPLIGRDRRLEQMRRKKLGVVGGDEERWLEEARGAAAASAW